MACTWRRSSWLLAAACSVDGGAAGADGPLVAAVRLSLGSRSVRVWRRRGILEAIVQADGLVSAGTDAEVHELTPKANAMAK